MVPTLSKSSRKNTNCNARFTQYFEILAKKPQHYLLAALGNITKDKRIKEIESSNRHSPLNFSNKS